MSGKFLLDMVDTPQLVVQEQIRSQGLDAVVTQYSLKVCHHPHLPLVILNYDQCKSPKYEPVTRECRGLVLDTNTWEVVGRSFERFYNVGESPNGDEDGPFTCIEKHDGSLVSCFAYRNVVMYTTRGSWGSAEWPSDEHATWLDAITSTIKPWLYTGLTTVFELCTPANRIVRHYGTYTYYLIACIDNETGEGLPESYLSSMKDPQPNRYEVPNIQAARDLLLTLPYTHEGFVLRRGEYRLKLKSPTYLNLHRKFSGQLMPKHYLRMVLDNEQDEYLAYYGEDAGAVGKYVAFVTEAKLQIAEDWADCKSLLDVSRKAFALEAKKGWTAPVLFQYANGRFDEDLLKILVQVWRRA